MSSKTKPYRVLIHGSGKPRRVFLETESKLRGLELAKKDKTGNKYTEIEIEQTWDKQVICRWTLCETKKGNVWKNLDKMYRTMYRTRGEV